MSQEKQSKRFISFNDVIVYPYTLVNGNQSSEQISTYKLKLYEENQTLFRVNRTYYEQFSSAFVTRSSNSN